MSGRGKAKQGHAFPGDFIALGSKVAFSQLSQLKPGCLQSGSSKAVAAAAPQHAAPVLHKSVKVKAMKGVGGSAERLHSSSSGPNQWEVVAMDYVDLNDLVPQVDDARLEGDHERVEGLLCGAVKALRASRAKPDAVAWLSLLSLAKSQPKLFSGSELVKDALCSLLKRDVRESFKSKGNCLVSVMAANVLYSAFQDITPWPESFLRVYVEDAMGERVWVDQTECKLFTDNILTAFNTILPPSATREGEVGLAHCPSPPTGCSSGSRTPTRQGLEEEEPEVEIIELPINRDVVTLESGVVQRYGARLVDRHWRMDERVEATVVEIVRDQLNRRQQGQGTENITRNFIKFLTYACGSGEVRQLAASRLEMWMMNPKISRSAQELLCGVTLNCVTHTQSDVEVMVLLTKLRLKSKPNINLFLTCIKELSVAHPNNLATLLKHTIFNELSNARNTNNMAILGVMFQAAPEKAAGALASVFLELLMQKDCYLRALRILLREIVRCLRHDINLVVFCECLMTDRLRDEFEFFREFEFKERMFTSLVDLVTLAIFLGVSPAVREGLNTVTRGERKDVSAYKKYLLSVSDTTRVAVKWLHETVLKVYKPEAATYTNCIYKALFMARSHEEYYQLDGWPLDTDRGLFFKLTSEVPLQQETILRIFLIGLSKAHPVIGQDCLTIAHELMKRAAGLHNLASKDFPVLYSDKAKDFRECVWNLTAYTFPETISLPPDYQPPSMAITASYWKAWQMLLIMTAYNPEEFGVYGWENYPTLRAMMEMCITSQPRKIGGSKSNRDSGEIEKIFPWLILALPKVSQLEKQQILEFESQLAAASSKQLITEQSSLLLSTITSMDPHGPLRRPPAAVLDQLKQMNSHYKLGHLLCRSRQPDFLLDILQRQGTNQAMPWLADLVESSEGSFSVLPVQCLCEFLLNDAFSQSEDEGGKGKKRKAGELLVHLQTMLQHPASDPNTCMETLDYFLARLSSVQSSARLQALSGLRLLLTPVQEEGMEVDLLEEETSSDWLLRHLPALPCFPLIHARLSASLRQACQVECDPPTVSLYIRFLSQTQKLELEEMGDLALDMATVIVERSSLMPALLPGTSHPAATGAPVQAATYSALLSIFYHYMQLVRQQDARVAWSESQDLINVVWGSGECATLHILVVHAQLILLTYGSATSDMELFNKMLLMWFPPGQELPRAYLVDTSEEALLIPDWLKLKMIRSSVPKLVDSALRELNPQQLVLFIQSFGIPVDSMSKLLQTLDQEVVEQEVEVINSVLDKAYMGQLVGVQHNRGAKGGLVFAKRLGLNLEVGGGAEKPRPSVAALPSLSIPPRSTAMIPPSQIRATLLHLYDCGSPSRMTMKEKQDTFRTLQKSLTAEICGTLSSRPMLDSTVLAIQAILGSDLGQGFTVSLTQKTAFSTGLFRLISVALAKPAMRSSTTASTLLEVSKKLLQQFQAAKATTPLIPLLKSYIEALEPGCKDTGKTSNSNDGGKTEDEIKSMAREALRKEDTAPLVSRLSSLLLQEREGPSRTAPYLAQEGLLVDWLELLDPTVISSCPELQQQLVFGRASPRVGRPPTPRPYLLSLLTHQASWEVVRGTVASLLTPSSVQELDPGAVLDFLTACIHIPRLWQGRDQRPPVHDQPPDVLALEGERLESLVDHVLAEAQESGEGGRQVVMARMEVVLRCVSTRSQLRVVVTHLMLKDSSLAKEFLTELYMRIPAALQAGENGLLPSACPLAGESVVDSVSHTLLSSLSSSVQQGKQWAVKMQEVELAARKLLSAHPDLFLRNLPLLASSLQGRTHLEFPIFRSRNHLTLFQIHLGLLELARPHVFNSSCLSSLVTAMTCFLEMLEAYFQRRESFYHTIDRLIQFLSSWQAAGGGASLRAAAFLRQHAQTLLRLHSAPGTLKMESLRGLVAGLAPALHARQGEQTSGEEPVPRSPPQEGLEPELARLLNDLQAAEPERLVPLMIELQSVSNPRPGVLTHFQDELAYHITSAVPQVRNYAYTLLLKHLKHQPGTWEKTLPAYMAALASDEEDKVEAALAHLPEIAIICQQKAGELLSAVFRLGIYSNVPATQHINAAIARLNVQGSS